MYWRHETADKYSEKIYSPHYNSEYSDQYYNDYFNPEIPITLKYFGISSRSPHNPIINRCNQKYGFFYILSGKGWCNGIPFEEGDIVYCDKSTPFSLSSNHEDPCTYTWISFCDGKSDLYIKLLGLGNTTKCYKSQHMQEIIQLFYKMIEADHNNINLPLYLESCLLHLLALSAPSTSIDSDNESTIPNSRVNAAIKYISDNFRNPDLQLKDIAAAVKSNEKYLQRIFKAEKGISIYKYITKIRMDAAVTLLCSSDYNINEISEFTGYNDRRCFSDAFKKHFGVYPSQYKQES